MVWDPLHDLIGFGDRDIERHANRGGWVPPVDIYETPDHYVLVAELPGFGPADFTVNATPGSVTLSGIRPPLDVEAPQYLRIERGQGDFSRTFSFPEAISVPGVEADLHEGLLTVTVPKSAFVAPQRIDIR